MWVTKTFPPSAPAPAPYVTFYNPLWAHQSKSLHASDACRKRLPWFLVDKRRFKDVRRLF